MVTSRVLVTGGAGFIGSPLADALVGKGHDVSVLDNLHPRVHAKALDFLSRGATRLRSGARDRETLAGALRAPDGVFHDAAAGGAGASMGQVERYGDANALPVPVPGTKPRGVFEDGIRERVAWGEKAEAVDRFDDAKRELESRGLVPR